MKKTNAMRLLDQAGIAYEVREYDGSDGLIDGKSVAAKVGMPYNAVYKTLVTQCDTAYFVFVIPVDANLDLKKAAKAAGVKRIEMLPLKALKPLTGYVHGGCSPVGMRKLFPTYIEEIAQLEPHIAVSGGQIGMQIILTPNVLAKAVGARFTDLIV